MNDICKICGNRIRIQIFRSLGYCSENCRKKLSYPLEKIKP